MYSIQIRPRIDVKLLKWNLLDFVPEPNEIYGQKAYYAMVTHGLEAPPLQVHMEFDVIYLLKLLENAPRDIIMNEYC